MVSTILLRPNPKIHVCSFACGTLSLLLRSDTFFRTKSSKRRKSPPLARPALPSQISIRVDLAPRTKLCHSPSDSYPSLNRTMAQRIRSVLFDGKQYLYLIFHIMPFWLNRLSGPRSCANCLEKSYSQLCKIVGRC